MDRKLSYKEQTRLMEDGNYRPMRELTSENVNIGDKLEVLNSYGEVVDWVLLTFRDANNPLVPNLKEAIARKESGEHNRGMEFVLDSSMADCYDIGWRVKREFS